MLNGGLSVQSLQANMINRYTMEPFIGMLRSLLLKSLQKKSKFIMLNSF